MPGGFDYSANISIMFTEFSYLDRPAAARRAGFDRVETWWPWSEAVASVEAESELVDALEQGGVGLSGLNFFAGDMPGGDRGIACHPDRAHDLECNTEQLVRIAERTGCRFFNLLYGQLDDRWPEEDQHAAATSAILRAAAAVRAIGGTVLLEPLAAGLNGRYPLVDGDDVVALLTGSLAGADNARLLFDLFHLGSNGVDLVDAARRLAPWIGHVQVADSPGRGEPGSGNLPIAEILEALTDAGYCGTAAAEYQPTTPATIDSLSWLPDPGPSA